MARTALRALLGLTLGGASIMWVVGCRTTAEADTGEAPTTAGPGNDPTAGSGPSRTRAPHEALIRDDAGPGARVAVASIAATEAQPCERVCGGLGDCLFGDAAYTDPVAQGLELRCLDICVHAPDTNAAKAEFLACGAVDDCGQLQACAERQWDALGEGRVAPEAAGIVASADPCKSGCRWFYACHYTDQPPGQAYLDSQGESEMQACIDHCDNNDESLRELMSRLADCLPSHCTRDELPQCWL